ncbi:MAG TPA: hypothetical protein VG012_04010 [Acidimicrobiia bacterium]|nr:hypothetical protein [Acidimicrobiia bacterium]
MSGNARWVAGGMAALAATAVALALALTTGARPASVVTPAQPAAAAGCQAPGAGPAAPPSQPVAPPAAVTVPGAVSIDTRGLVPGAVTETADGQPWAIVRDPRSAATSGLVARVDTARRVLGAVTPVVDHCTATAITAQGSSVWVATCDPSATGTAADAELVRVDGQGQIGARVAMPTACVTQLAAGAHTVWATSAPSTTGSPRLFRLDTATGRVDEPTPLHGEQLSGIAVLGDDPWTARTAATGARLVRADHATGADLASLPTGALRVGGIVGTTLWVEDTSAGTLVARDATTGSAAASVPVADLRAFAVGSSGVWYEQASPASQTITIGRVGPTNTAAAVTAFTGPGPDRTGLPFLGTLSATTGGAWLATQDHLFLVHA